MITLILLGNISVIKLRLATHSSKSNKQEASVHLGSSGSHWWYLLWESLLSVTVSLQFRVYAPPLVGLQQSIAGTQLNLGE